MALSDMIILLMDWGCSDRGDRPDAGRSSHRQSLLEEIYSAVVGMSSLSRIFFCSDALGMAPRHHRQGLQPVVRPEPATPRAPRVTFAVTAGRRLRLRGRPDCLSPPCTPGWLPGRPFCHAPSGVTAVARAEAISCIVRAEAI